MGPDGPQREEVHVSSTENSVHSGVGNGTAVNVVVLAGRLSGDPVVTQLKSGDELRRYEVTIPPGDTPGGPVRAETVPVVWFSPRRPPSLSEGSRVVVVGRVRRRYFRTVGGTASRTEVVAERVWRDSPDRRGRAQALSTARLKAGLGG